MTACAVEPSTTGRRGRPASPGSAAPPWRRSPRPRPRRRRPGPGSAGGRRCPPRRRPRRQGEVDHLAQEPVRHLDEQAGAVTGVGLGALGAAVVEVAQRGEAQLDDAVRRPALQVHHEGDAAGVVLEGRVVKALRTGDALHWSVRCSWGERDPCRSGPGHHWPCRSLPSVPSAGPGGYFIQLTGGRRAAHPPA